MTDAADDLARALLEVRAITSLLDDHVYGREMFEPAYPHHGTPRRCPFCDRVYRVHGGFADHRDRCTEGPNPGSNPVTTAQ